MHDSTDHHNSTNDAVADLYLLVEVARQLGETFDLDSLLKSIEQAGCMALRCERANVYLYDAHHDELHSKIIANDGRIEEIRFSATRGIVGDSVKTPSVILALDAYADPRFNPDVDRITGFRTRNSLTLPLVVPGGEVVGALQVLNKIDGQFNDHDQLLASALGSLAGVAIKRQRLFDEAEAKHQLERELDIAHDVQQRLLPTNVPQVSGYDIAGWSLPTGQTGGDLYDYFSLVDGRVAIMIADATGHGIGPALIVSQCRSVLRAIANEQATPAQLIRRLNALLCDDLPCDRFVTLCLCILNSCEHRIDYVSGGHGPQWHIEGATGQVRPYDATCVPLGILKELEMDAIEPVFMAPGDLFVMITDGFLEWMNPADERYGRDRLIKLLQQHRDRDESCTELIQRLYQDVLAFSQGTPQKDDLTVVVIKRGRSSL
ncbi:MAG: SpoIIE family protein phosphatase [Phycisphaerae bacterium]|nr:SpoIIE family protein phosphatase [Phycisphaerae bacterium]